MHMPSQTRHHYPIAYVISSVSVRRLCFKVGVWVRLHESSLAIRVSKAILAACAGCGISSWFSAQSRRLCSCLYHAIHFPTRPQLEAPDLEAIKFVRSQKVSW